MPYIKEVPPYKGYSELWVFEQKAGWVMGDWTELVDTPLDCYEY